MYDFFKSIVFFLFLFSVMFFATSFIFIGCKSSELLPDDGTGITSYRELQSDIRDGETELAVTGSELESTSERIEESVRDIIQSGERLERQLTESENEEQEIGTVLQRIRKRKIESNKLSELGIEFQE